MDKQTQDKSIAERFKEVALGISDEEIKQIIKDELREQIKNQVDFGSTIGEWVEVMLEEDEEWIELVRDCMRKSIKDKFK